MVRCSDCGAHRTADMPTPDQVTEMYDGDAIYSPPTEVAYQDSKRHFTLIANEFDRPCPEHSRRLLEIGCNSGYALDAFQEQGWDVTGCEANGRLSDDARRRVSCRIVRALDELGPAERFDLILLSHVLEHIVEPVPFLAGLAARLKPDGQLYVFVPNYGSMFVRHLYRHNWPGYVPLQHVWYFDPRSLRRLLAMSGMRLVRMRNRGLMRFRGRSLIVTLLKFPLVLLQRLMPMQGQELGAIFEANIKDPKADATVHRHGLSSDPHSSLWVMPLALFLAVIVLLVVGVTWWIHH